MVGEGLKEWVLRVHVVFNCLGLDSLMHRIQYYYYHKHLNLIWK